MVKSKSEVMVAEILSKLCVEYSYEEPFEANGKNIIQTLQFEIKVELHNLLMIIR